MKKIYIVLLAAVLATACLKGSYESNYNAVCNFEFVDIQNIDSIYHKNSFGEGGFIFCNKNDGTSEDIKGGFIFSMLCDTTYKAGHVSRSPFCVADTTAIGKCFLVYWKQDEASMPEHDIVFASSQYGTATPKNCYINNTNEVANIAMFGKDGVPAFAEGDYLKLTVSATLNNVVKEKKAEIFLAKYEGTLKVLTDWTKFDISGLGDFDYLDFNLSSNRSDLPMRCCMDLFVVQVAIKQ